MHRSFRFAAIFATILVGGSFTATMLPGCRDTVAIEKSKTDAMGMLSKLTSRATAASTMLGGLMTSLDALPAATPGLAEVKSKLTGFKTSLDAITAKLGGFGGKLTTAATSGTEEIAKVVKEIEAEATKLAPIEAGLTEASKAVDDLKAASMWMKQLTTGFQLSGATTGIESQLVTFIEDPARPVDKTTWFNFDRLNFQTGKAELDMEASKAQLDNMTEILKAFPAVKLKIGGYTDNTGAADANMKLSTERAEAVKAALVAAGVTADRLAAEGYGPEHPVCPANDTDECKAQNRRIAVRVSAK